MRCFEFLRRSGLKILEVAADGDCFFHAVLLQLLSYTSVLHLREDLCNHIQLHFDLYKPFLDTADKGFHNDLIELRRLGKWQNNTADLLVLALANLISRRVVVLSTLSPTQVFIPSNNKPDGPDIVLLHNQNHYSALSPIFNDDPSIKAPNLHNKTYSDIVINFKPVKPYSSYNVSHDISNTFTTDASHTPTPSHKKNSAYNTIATDARHTPTPSFKKNSANNTTTIDANLTSPTSYKKNFTNFDADAPMSGLPQQTSPATNSFTAETKVKSKSTPLNCTPGRNFNRNEQYLPLPDKCQQMFNNFRRAQNKFILSFLHLSTLLIYHHHQFVPRGLLLHLSPCMTTSSNMDKTLLFLWKSTLKNSSLILMEHIINHLQTQLLQLTPIVNNLLKDILFQLDSSLSQAVICRLRQYAFRTWNKTYKEKNRKLYLDLKIQNETKFSETFLSALYQNPFKIHTFDKSFIPGLKSKTQTDTFRYDQTSNSKSRNRRFIKRNIYKKINKTATTCQDIPNNVVNLSNHELNPHEYEVLSKNLQFCPTPNKPDPIALSLDVFEFGRRLRLKEYFYKEETEEEYDPSDLKNHPRLKKVNTFTPNSGRDVGLDTYINCITEDIMTNTNVPKFSNLTANQKHALKTLEKNDNITIKPADKGGAVVVLNTSDYIDECNRQLTDKTFYKPLLSDPTQSYHKTIVDTLHNATKLGHIDTDMANLLIQKHPKASRFYTLPKIHKKDNPGRPIISGNGSPTEKISIFVDKHLKPLVTSLDSYVHDDMDFLKKIEDINNQNIINSNTILCTMDVSALYTNIPHTDGTDACRHYLDTRPDRTTPTSFLCTLIQLILSLNNFVFNNNNFLQIQGTAMGTSMAPSYANLFMGHFETNFLQTCLQKPIVWLRYIDDIFLLWNEGKDKLLHFISAANIFHPTIKFTFEISTSVINFLDIAVHKTINNRLETDLYCKPTDAHLYLHYSSCHPRNTKHSLPYSLAFRLLRICSTKEFLLKRLSELKDFLLNRQYRLKDIDSAFDRLKDISRHDTFKRKNKSKKLDRVPFITTFNPGLPNITHILGKYFHILQSSDRCRKAISNLPILSFRRSTNLRDILVHAAVKTHQTLGFHSCRDKRCKTCKSALFTNNIKISTTGQIFNIKHSLTCKSFNIIYLITCKKCSKQYVGKTETPLNIRVNNYRCFINTKRKDNLANHFYTNGHTFLDFQITAIDMISNADTHSLCNKETYYIKLFQTTQPTGLNSHSQNIYPIAVY